MGATGSVCAQTATVIDVQGGLPKPRRENALTHFGPSTVGLTLRLDVRDASRLWKGLQMPKELEPLSGNMYFHFKSFTLHKIRGVLSSEQHVYSCNHEGALAQPKVGYL